MVGDRVGVIGGPFMAAGTSTIKIDPADMPCGTHACIILPSGADTWSVWPPKTPGGTTTGYTSKRQILTLDIMNMINHKKNNGSSNLP